MSIFSRIFGGSKKHPIKKHFEETTEQSRKEMQRVGERSLAITKDAIEKSMKQMQPVREISLSIMAAAVVIRDALKKFTKREPPDEDVGVSIEIAVFYESIFFFRHLTRRIACHKLTRSQLNRFDSCLDPLLAVTAISSYYNVCSERFPQDLKDRAIDDYYDSLNNTELELTGCTESDSVKDGKERWEEIMHALLIQIVKSISSLLSENQEYSAKVMLVMDHGIAQFFDSNLANTIAELAQVELPCVDSGDLLQHLIACSK
jgi:hypothetical protein